MRKLTIDLLMLIIAVVALGLGGFMGPGRMPSREIWRRPHCQSNLRTIVLGVLQYANNQGAFPRGTWPNASLPPDKRLSWYAAILPYLEAEDLWNQLDKTQPWDGDANRQIAGTPIGILRCPDVPGLPPDRPMPTQYIGIAGIGADAPLLSEGHPRAGVFGYERRTTLADLKDGAANTMVVAESARVGRSWLEGGPATVRGLDTADLPYIGPGRQFGHVLRSGTNVAFADGSVRWVSARINPRVLEAVSTIAGGETLPADRFP